MKLASSIFVLLSFFSTYAQSVKIGEQEWMTQNLEVTQFNNGESIPQAQSSEEWEEAGFNQKPAWCYVTTYVEENEVIVKQYGKLYNSFAINDPRGMVPEGWRLSTVDDWFVLQQQLEQMNLSIQEIDGSFLVISQFTLHASTKKGNRPSYIQAAKPEQAIPLYNYFVEELKSKSNLKVETGQFGADMKVSLINDGPVTIWMDSKNRE